jgi:hypothetical protein
VSSLLKVVMNLSDKRSRANLLEKRNSHRNLSLVGKVQAAYFDCMKRISAVLEATSTFVLPCR